MRTQYSLKTAPDPISKIRASLDHYDLIESMAVQGKLTRNSRGDNDRFVGSILLTNAPAALDHIDTLEAQNEAARQRIEHLEAALAVVWRITQEMNPQSPLGIPEFRTWLQQHIVEGMGSIERLQEQLDK